MREERCQGSSTVLDKWKGLAVQHLSQNQGHWAVLPFTRSVQCEWCGLKPSGKAPVHSPKPHTLTPSLVLTLVILCLWGDPEHKDHCFSKPILKDQMSPGPIEKERTW